MDLLVEFKLCHPIDVEVLEVLQVLILLADILRLF